MNQKEPILIDASQRQRGGRAVLLCVMWLLASIVSQSGAAPVERRRMPELTASEAERLTSAGEDNRLAEKVWADGPQRDHPAIQVHPDRLDAWLVLGGMNANLARRYSPPTLLSRLAGKGIHHSASVAAEHWMLQQFSIAYWLHLQTVNQQRFPEANRASGSIRKALWSIDELMSRLTGDRSYTGDMVWGQAEWLLHQAKPTYLADQRPDQTFGKIPLSTLRKELADCRDASGSLCGVNYSRDPDKADLFEETLRTVSKCLESWTPAGKDYLLTEFLLVVRDRVYYYYGGPPTPRAVAVIGRHAYQNPGSYPDRTTRIGKVVVTLSQGHRQIWDSSPDCGLAKISWADVSWVKHAKPGDTPASARQTLRVVKDGVIHDLKPKGGFILDFDGFVFSGASVLSEDASGGVWLERFDLATRKAIERFSLLQPPPNPLPDWASPFRQRWGVVGRRLTD